MCVIDQHSSKPLYQQLVDQIKVQIRHDSDLHQLPSLRVVAQATNLSKNTVATACNQLIAEGWLINRVRQGYFVNPQKRSKQATNQSVSMTVPAEVLNLRYAAPLTATTTQNAWKAAVRLAMQTQFMGVADEQLGRQGLMSLRRLICAQLEARRGIQCVPEQIVLTTGTADGLTIICQLMNLPLSASMENPGYRTAYATLQRAGVKVELCPVGDQGIDLKTFAKQNSQLVYVTPAHQFPMGGQLPLDQRRELLKIIQARQGLVIEDDYDCEFNYQAQPIAALTALAPESCCYLGSFSKVLSPSLRVGYLVLPPHLTAKYRQVYQYDSSPVSYLVQQALVNFITSHAYDRHVQRSLTQNRRKYRLVNAALQPAIQAGTIQANLYEHGLHVVFKLNNRQQLVHFKELLGTNRIELASLDRYCLNDQPSAGFVLGFAHLNVADLKQALGKLEKCLAAITVPEKNS